MKVAQDIGCNLSAFYNFNCQSTYQSFKHIYCAMSYISCFVLNDALSLKKQSLIRSLKAIRHKQINLVSVHRQNELVIKNILVQSKKRRHF